MLLNQTLSLVLLGLLFTWLAILSVLFYNLFRHYQKLTRGVVKKDLKAVLEKILANLGQETKKTAELAKALERLEKEGVYHVQKIGLVRFNPFAETGGDQSFSLAALDQKDSGFIISSLHGRDGTRIYAKLITAGKAKGYQLSDEEKRAIKNAKKIK